MLHKFSSAILLIMVVAFSYCSKSSSYGSNPGSGTTGTGANTVNIQYMTFSPGNLTVSVGTAVKWTNNDGVSHTVTSNDGTSFDSGTLGAGSNYSHTFTTAGTFPYHCTIHTGMAGTITVTP